MAGSRAPKTKRKRPGRPPQGEYVDKRKTLSTRITSGLRDRLDKSADESGRSLSQEIEFRLEQSFRDEKALYREFGDKSLYMTMRWFALTLDEAQQITEKPWKKDEETFGIAIKALWTMLQKRKGLPAPPPLRGTSFAEYKRLIERSGKRVGEKLFRLGTQDRKRE